MTDELTKELLEPQKLSFSYFYPLKIARSFNVSRFYSTQEEEELCVFYQLTVETQDTTKDPV